MNTISGEKIKYRHALITGAILAVMYLIVLVLCRITPLGDKTFLMYDMKRQYVDYYAYLRTIWSGENNIWYSFSTALGSGMVGFDIYYVSSPFLLLLLLFPTKYLPIGITLIIGIKLVFAAIIMDIFLQYYYADDRFEMKLLNTQSVAVAMGALSWAFSSFLFAHSMNAMWMDVIILLPVLLWALDHILIDNKTLPYILVLAAMLLLNYYITYQVLIFVALWTIVRLVLLEDRSPFKKIGRVFIATIIPPFMDALFLLPTVYELADSPKDITQLGLATQDKNLSIVDVLSKIPTLSYDYIEARFGSPQIFCGVLFIILCFIFFICPKIKIKEKICMLAVFSFLMLSFCKDIVNLFMHAGMEPSGHPYRQAFQWIFIMVICAVRVLYELESVNFIQRIAACVLTGVLFFFVLRTRYDHITMLTVIVNVILLAVYVFLFAFVLGINKLKIFKLKKAAVILLVTLQLADLGLNACYTYIWQSENCNKQSEYKAAVEKTSEAVKYVKENDKDFYRMENLTPRQQNDGMQYAYNGITHYSSAGKTYVRYFLQQMGYNDDSLYTHYGHDNTATADALLGVKYLVSDGTVIVHPDYVNIFRDEMTGEMVFENPFDLSAAIGTNDYDLSDIGIPQILLSSDNWSEGLPDIKGPFALQEEMMTRIAGYDTHIFTDAEVSENIILGDDGNLNAEYEIVTGCNGELYMYLDGILDKIQGFNVLLEGEAISTYGNEACMKVLNLGFYPDGATVHVQIYGGSPEADFGTALFVTENTDELARVCEDISARNAKIKKLSSSHLLIEVENCNGCYMSIPCERGWKVKVDGKKTELTSIYGALSYVDIPENGENTHTIEMVYVPEGFEIGAVVSAFTAIFLILWIINSKRKISAKLPVGLAALLLVLIFIFADTENFFNKADAMYARINGEKISVYTSDDINYLFLPGYADENEIELSASAAAVDIEIMKSSKIAAVFIDTKSGSLDKIYEDKDYRETGKIRVYDESGNICLSGGLKAIGGHGNYSWSGEEWDKKPFAITLDNEQQLLGLGSSKKYTLIANASDATLVRNDLARRMEETLEIPFSHTGVFIDLYINSEYMGNYYLCDDIAVGPEQIDIYDMEAEVAAYYKNINMNSYDVNETVEYKAHDLPIEAEDITGGYLIEREFGDRYNIEYPYIGSGFMTDRGEDFVVEAPKYCSLNQILYIRNYINETDRAITGANGYNPDTGLYYYDYIDADSFAKRYLTEEICKNYDAGNSSAYFFKDRDDRGGKLYYGPGWDYDMTLGNYQDWMEYSEPTGITYGMSNEHANDWFKYLCSIPEFEDNVKTKFVSAVIPFMNEILEEGIDEYEIKLGASASMDAVRWNNMYRKCSYTAGDAEEYDKLKEFISKRMDFLCEEWGK